MREKPTYEELEKRIQELEAAETKWKRTEAALRESQNKYQTLFEAANDAIFVADAATGILVEANRKAEALTGKSKDELVGMHQSGLHPSEIKIFSKTLFRKHAEANGNHLFFVENWVEREDGRKIPVEISPANIEIHGKPHLIGIFRDVSEQKKSNEALRRYAAIVNAITDPVSYVDRDYKYQIVGEVYAVYSGKPKEEIAGKPVWEVMGTEIFETIVRPHLDRCFAGEQVCYESWFSLPGGPSTYQEVRYYPVFDESGESVVGAAVLSRDHTARKNAEEALKKSQAGYQAVFEQAAVGIGSARPDGKILDANKALCDLLGYSREELLRATVSEITWPEDAAVENELIQEVIEGKRDAFHLEKRLLHKNGHPIWVHHSSNVVRLGRQEDTFAIGVSVDITDRKQVELALREREERHRIISELSTDYFYRLKIEGSDNISIDWVSDSFERVTTYQRGELNQFETWLSKIHPKDLENLEENTENLLANRPVWSHYRFTTRNGETRWLADRLHPEWSAAENRVVGAYGAVRDITERKKSEEALRESEARFRAIFEQAAAGIATATAEGMFLETNRTLRDMLGYTAGELRGLSVYDLTFSDDREKQVDLDKLVLEGESDTVRLEKRFLHKAGHPVWANLASNVVRDEAGNIQYVIGVVVDIDQRKRMEEALLEALEEKEILLREIHHRVKNNMQAIVSLLRMHSRMDADVPFQSIFEDCRGRIEAMALVHEALYQSNDLIHIDFQAYLRKLCRNLARVHAATSNGISIEVAPTEVSVGMDQGIALGMVIAELISNAFKHAFPPGGAGKVAIGIRQLESGIVELAVSDNGIGPPADLDIRNPDTLGLKLVSGAVQRELGGTLELERNGGATFIVRFPCNAR